jgi:ribosomal protein S21
VPTNTTVKLRRGETGEKLIRRFIRKCKKDKVVEDYRSKTDHYIKPSVKKRMKREKAQRAREKLERTRAAKSFR